MEEKRKGGTGGGEGGRSKCRCKSKQILTQQATSSASNDQNPPSWPIHPLPILHIASYCFPLRPQDSLPMEEKRKGGTGGGEGGRSKCRCISKQIITQQATSSASNDQNPPSWPLHPLPILPATSFFFPFWPQDSLPMEEKRKGGTGGGREGRVSAGANENKSSHNKQHLARPITKTLPPGPSIPSQSYISLPISFLFRLVDLL